MNVSRLHFFLGRKISTRSTHEKILETHKPQGAVGAVKSIRSSQLRIHAITPFKIARLVALFLIFTAKPDIGLSLEKTSTSTIGPQFIATDPYLHNYINSYLIQLTSFPPAMPPSESGQKYINFLFISGPGTISQNRIAENALARMPSNVASSVKSVPTIDNICFIESLYGGDAPDQIEMVVAVNNSTTSGSLDNEKRCFLRSVAIFEHIDLKSLSDLTLPQIAIETFKTAWGLN